MNPSAATHMRDMSSESAADVAADVVEECVAHDERAEHFERVEAILVCFFGGRQHLVGVLARTHFVLHVG